MKNRIAMLAVMFCAAPAMAAGTTFLNHFDTTPGAGAGAADFAGGNPANTAVPPFGPGGNVVAAPARFGNALHRFNGIDVGGRVTYEIANNWNVNKGTVEMFINSANILGGGFVGLMGTDTSSGAGDIRMYIYDTGAGRTLGAYQLGAGGPFWEIEQVIPTPLLTNNAWHHVVWAFDTAAGKTATWWDGQLLRNTPDAGTVSPRTALGSTRFHIGENQGGSAGFPGFIDEFRISDIVQYDMNSNLTVPTAPFAIPEPGSLGLLGAAGLCMVRLRR